MVTERDRMHLSYLARAERPLWGGHLERDQPITDPDMQRWLDLGLIERVGMEGYMLTAKGRSAVNADHHEDRT